MNTKTKSTKLSMKDLLESNKEWFQLPYAGDTVQGTVIGKESGALYIDLGSFGTGIVYGREYFAVQDTIKNLEPGTTVSAKIIEIENEDGLRELSMKKIGDEKNWQFLKNLKDKNETVEVKITGANKGGLLVQVGSMNGFLPVSQLAPIHYPRVEGGNKEMILEKLQKFVNQKIVVRVLDLDSGEGKIIFSERAAEDDKMKSAIAKFQIGDIVEGAITGVVDFGAFIKFDPLLEGLIHISEMDWNLVKDPNDILKVGDKVTAKIVEIADDGRVSLSMKAMKNDPWDIIEERFAINNELTREVVAINSYGVLVKIDDGIQGLVHVSEFENEKEMREKCKTGESYTFKIKSIEPQKRKISLVLS